MQEVIINMSSDSPSRKQISINYNYERIIFDSIEEVNFIIENMYIAEYHKYNYKCSDFNCFKDPSGITQFEIKKDKYIQIKDDHTCRVLQNKLYNAIKRYMTDNLIINETESEEIAIN